jgi:hypothetical protein
VLNGGDFEYLIVAGGGGGGYGRYSGAGGGGAGGLLKFIAGESGNTDSLPLSLSATAYSVTIGDGGLGGNLTRAGLNGQE